MQGFAYICLLGARSWNAIFICEVIIIMPAPLLGSGRQVPIMAAGIPTYYTCTQYISYREERMSFLHLISDHALWFLTTPLHFSLCHLTSDQATHFWPCLFISDFTPPSPSGHPFVTVPSAFWMCPLSLFMHHRNPIITRINSNKITFYLLLPQNNFY